jgi:hypothetical protein
MVLPTCYNLQAMDGPEDTMPKRKKNPHAVALGKKGGKKGGKARWEGVPPEERSEILRKAVQARWSRKRPQP